MTMVRILNTVAVTLLIALAAVVPAAFIGRYLPILFESGIKEIAVAAWLAALGSWFLARMIMKNEHQAAHESNKSSGAGSVKIAVLFLTVAVGIAVGLHFYGTRLLPW